MDPVTDTILIGLTAEELVTGIGTILTEIEAFLGYEGMQAAYDIIHGLGQFELDTILPQLVFDGGQVSIVGGELVGFTVENASNILSAMGTIAKILFQKGVDMSTAAGKEIFAAIIDKIKTYGGSIAASTVGNFVGQEIAKRQFVRPGSIAPRTGIRPF
jgi:hypothetical protein